MKRFQSLLIGLTTSAAALGCAVPSPPLATALIDTLPSGTIRVTNLAPTARHGDDHWRLVVDQVIQPPEGDAFEIVQGGFGAEGLNRLAVDRAGQVYVADQPPATILVFAPDGTPLRRIGREGDGPGEYRAHGIILVGDTLIALTGHMGRAVTLFARDGTPLARWDAPSSQMLARAHADTLGGLWLVDMTVRPPVLRRLDLSGRVTGAIELLRDAGGRFNPNGVIVTPSGGAVLGHQSRSEWYLLTLAGDTLRHIVAPDGTVSLTDSALAARRERAEQRARNNPLAATAGSASLEVPATTSSWQSMTQDDAGRWWIGRFNATGAADRWDLFTPEGVLLGAVSMPALFRTGKVRDAVWHDGRLFSLVRHWGPGERPAIVVYRLEGG
jgi:sugar lactone lactonase YvrE